jgi:hypothetical protein
MGTDAVIKKVQTKILQSTSKTEQHKFKTTLELLKAAKTGGEDLNIKLDIICPPIFDNEYSKNFFEKYSELYKAFGKYGFSLLNNKQIAQTYQVIEEIIKAGGNLKGVSKEFENYVCGTSSPEIVKLLFKEPIPQDVSSTTSTTTTSVSTTSSLEKPSSSSGSSSTSELQTTTAVSTAVLPLGGDYIDGENMSTTVTTSCTVKALTTSRSSTILFSPLDPLVSTTEDSSLELTGQSLTTDEV